MIKLVPLKLAGPSLFHLPGLSNEEVNVGVQRGSTRLHAPDTAHPKLRLLMDRCFEDRAKNRPSFLQIIEILKNDVRPEFLENSFFGSKLGQMVVGGNGAEQVGIEYSRSTHRGVDEDTPERRAVCNVGVDSVYLYFKCSLPPSECDCRESKR